MSEAFQQTKVSQERQALVALRRMRAKLDDIERKRTEPIAIIGMGCRVPGSVSDLEGFWDLLRNAVDAITEVPPDRWDINTYYNSDPHAPGKMYTRSAGFIDHIDQFDPHFFGISPREAASMDPQQRLLLEVSWEALENAGQAPDRLFGSSTGVFVGVSNNDYLQLAVRAYEDEQIDAYLGTGNGPSLLSGRLSYLLGLEGPSLTVDTACSTSLVAIHLACRSLRNGECDMALAGAANAMITPITNLIFCRAQALSPSGRCKSFDAGADGYARAEGCGMVVLKRLSKAIEDKDPILAVIRGTAINQDGRSNGLTAPNQMAQEKVIAAALMDGGIDPSEVSYIEAHGTGTPLGDPIEIHALASVFGKARSSDHPLVIGCVKTNIGHLESAAGVAGLIKVVLALMHEEIPAHLHLKKLNPHIPVDDFPFVIPIRSMSWSSGQKKRIAGVSAFGFSGTNAHVVLEEAPKIERKQTEKDRPFHLLALSAKSEKALSELAKRYEEHLGTHPGESLADACFTANAGRAHFERRFAVVGQSSRQVQEQLGAFLRGERPAGVLNGQAKAAIRPEVVFLFTGQGSQYVGMGRELYETQPTFHKALDRCDELLRGRLEKPLLSVLYPQPGEESPLNETAYTQPALFALEYALYELWRSWGIEPSVVMGHSVGEYVAACVAGVFSLEDGLRLIAERGRLIQGLPKDGEMAAVFAGEGRVGAAIAGYRETVSIAAVNGPENTVISGARESVEEVLRKLEAEGIVGQRLVVSHAFHSPLMDPILGAFEGAASEVSYFSPRMGLISNVTGRLATDDEMSSPGYWRRHVRAPVQFYRSMQVLQGRGENVFVELGPHPVLLGMGAQCLPKGEMVCLPSLRRGQNDWGQMLESLAELYVRGTQVNWDGFDRDYPRRRINLPTYPFQRERYWIETASQKSEVATEPYRKAASTRSSHPLLGQRLLSALKANQYESRLSSKTLPFARDHRFYGMAVLPATAFLEMAMAARAEASPTSAHALEEVAFIEALTFGEDDAKTVQVILSSEESDATVFQVFSLNDGEGEEWGSWRLHATGKISPVGKGSAAPASASLQSIRARCRDELSVGDFYRHLRELGVEYGPSMQGIERLWRGNREALGRLRLPAALASEGDIYQFHPVLLDSCLQLIGAILVRDLGVNSKHDVYMPFALNSLRVFEKPNTHLWGHAFIRDGYGLDAEIVVGDLFVFDEAGRTVAEISGLRFKRASREALLRVTQRSLRDWIYEVAWQPKPLGKTDHRGEQSPPPAQPGSWLVFADSGGVGSRLERRLEQQGGTCVMVYPGDRYAVPGERRYQIDPLKAEDFQRMLREVQVRWGQGLLGIVHLWSLDLKLPQKTAISGLSRSQELSCGSVVHLVQALARAEALPSARLWLVTRGAQAVSPGPVPTALAQTPLLGLGTAIDLEHPDLRCTRIDLDPIDENPTGDQELFDEIWSKDSENQVAFRSSGRHVPRLVPSGAKVQRSEDSASIVGKQPFELRIPSAATPDHPTETFRSDSTYLITGGLGGLGLLVARWMMERGVRHLALMSRGEAAGAASETINELRQAGAQVLVTQADVSQREQVADALAEMGRSMPPLRGIVHCAGVIDDGMLLQQNWKRFGEVLAPKVEGAWNLHCLTLNMPLDFFVLFSSAASLLGSIGQANYGAANAFLDALAHRRRAEGLAALSINWGPWARVGMTANLGNRENERWAEQGLVLIEPDQGIQVLEKVMQQDAPQVAVLPIHWPKLLKQFPRGGEPPLLAEISQRTLSSVEADRGSGETGDLSRKLANADPEDRHELLFDHICSEVIKVLRLGPSFELKSDQGLTELGMDSLMAVELANRLKRSLGRSLPPTLAFERPTIAALCSYLSNQVLEVADAQVPSGEPDKEIPPQASQMEELASLSEEELERTLTAELEREGY